jgi:ABC-type sulfate transport system permease subunit
MNDPYIADDFSKALAYIAKRDAQYDRRMAIALTVACISVAVNVILVALAWVLG